MRMFKARGEAWCQQSLGSGVVGLKLDLLGYMLEKIGGGGGLRVETW